MRLLLLIVAAVLLFCAAALAFDWVSADVDAHGLAWLGLCAFAVAHFVPDRWGRVS